MTQPPDAPLDGLYGDAIMDHYRHPRCRQPVQNPDLVTHDFNPLCGDEVTLQLRLDDSRRVVAVSSHSQGCSIIQASASMLAEAMEGLTLSQLTDLSQTFRDMMQGKPLPETDAGQTWATWKPCRRSASTQCASSAPSCPGQPWSRASETTAATTTLGDRRSSAGSG